MKLYQPFVDTNIATAGVYTTLFEGDAVDVSGELFVSMGQDYMQRATPERGWTSSRRDAKRACADKVEDLAQVLLAQAQRLREEADGLPA
jgi:hypothetical protein